ncbi:hypothetical protein ACVIW2_005916 [Bradyrhizobium huanghuaihaiense]
MVNSRRLANVVAYSLGHPVTETLQHARNLRMGKGAKDGPLLTSGGRGRHAPEMTHEDAASLICAVLGSEAIKDSIATVEAMRNLKGEFQRKHFIKEPRLGQGSSFDEDDYTDQYERLPPPLGLGIDRAHNLIQALARVIEFFGREQDYVRALSEYDQREHEIYAVLEVEYPQHYVSLTVGVRNLLQETWIYGRRSRARKEQIRRCREYQLREISAAMLSDSTGEGEEQ